MKNFNIKVGSDNGNSIHKIVIDETFIGQPNVVSKVRRIVGLEELNSDYIIENIEDNLIVSIDSLSCETGNYFIGKKALNSRETKRNIEIGTDNNKFLSDVIIITTLGQIAGYVLKKNKEEILSQNETVKIDVDMTTALPIKQHNKKNSKEFSEKFMNKKHKLKLYVNDIVQVDFEIFFSYVKVLPEGVDAVFALTKDDKYINNYNSHSNINKDIEFFSNKKILHIPIGEGTTDLAITDGEIYHPELNVGLNNGIGYAIERGIEEIKDEIGIRDISRQEVSEITRNRNHKFNQIVIEVTKPYIGSESEIILRTVKAQLQSINYDIDMIIVYGGGSILMKEYIYNPLNDICQKYKIDLYYVSPELCTRIEADGLYVFTTSDIFESIKEELKNNS